MDFLIFFSLGVVIICVWLFTKLRKEKKKYKELSTKNLELFTENKLLEAEHLKFQLQPHTLRNMVATLHVASKNLYKGAEALSETLDYILYQGNKHLVSIQEELFFLENYKSLQGNFVHQIDSIKIDKSQVNTHSIFFNSSCIPHLITAYFVENAFKHGDLNHPEFLNICLKLSDKTFEMVVTNRIRQKPAMSKGGIGLANMRKRLDLLLYGKYELKQSCNEHEYYSTLIINF
jgi:LytS/YehU family sensor histidine kinase